jgi:hypothetical protein
MQEQMNDRTVALSAKAAKLTGRLLAKAMRAFLKKAREPAAKLGRQSLKSLARQGASLSNIEISGDNIGSFSSVARKYNVGFSLKRDDSGSPPKWIAFFKAKDADAITAAFGEYSRSQLPRKERRPSLLGRLEKARGLASQAAPPAKNRGKGGHEL